MKQLESVDLEDWAREKQMREVDEMVGTFEREVRVSYPPPLFFPQSSVGMMRVN